MSKKIKIESLNNVILFEFEKENNSIKDTVEEAVKNGTNLRDANLYGADLRGANLRGANLYGADLRDAILCEANMRGADLCDANLRKTNLYCVDLRGAILSETDLCGAFLCGAYLRGANLCGTNLCGTDLRGADLRDVNLYEANLCEANIRGAILCGANLRKTNNIPYIPYSCPSDGSFIGWKKVSTYMENYKGKFLIKLEIPEDARRCSATSIKCRCDKAKVLSITNIESGETVDVITNINEKECVYKVGEMVYPDYFDDNRWIECSHGIHFFINKQSAIDY